jgi:CheY-like chemotaxis protein
MQNSSRPWSSLLTNVMGGDISVRSEVGKGSVFCVKLLLSEVSRPRIASTMEDRVRGYVGPRQTILVVDDNEIQRHLVRDLLAPLGFEIVSAPTGRDCLLFAEQHRPNLVLLDITMPEMDGWQVAQRIRHTRERIAIVMLSANPIDPNHMLDAGRLYDDSVMKPIDLRQLLKKIHALLDIEWIYEPAAPFPAVPSAAATALVAPPYDDLNELIRLGEIGHIRRILDKLSEIETRSPECVDFVARIRTIVDSFDLRHYATALAGIRDSHA